MSRRHRPRRGEFLPAHKQQAWPRGPHHGTSRPGSDGFAGRKPRLAIRVEEPCVRWPMRGYRQPAASRRHRPLKCAVQRRAMVRRARRRSRPKTVFLQGGEVADPARASSRSAAGGKTPCRPTGSGSRLKCGSTVASTRSRRQCAQPPGARGICRPCRAVQGVTATQSILRVTVDHWPTLHRLRRTCRSSSEMSGSRQPWIAPAPAHPRQRPARWAHRAGCGPSKLAERFKAERLDLGLLHVGWAAYRAKQGPAASPAPAKPLCSTGEHLHPRLARRNIALQPPSGFTAAAGRDLDDRRRGPARQQQRQGRAGAMEDAPLGDVDQLSPRHRGRFRR